MRKILILSLVFVLQSGVYAADWEKHLSGLYIDKSSINLGNNSVSGWSTQFNFGQIKKIDNKKVAYMISYSTANCLERKLATHNVAYYDKKEHLLQTFDWAGNETFTRVFPDTFGENLLNALCSYK